MRVVSKNPRKGEGEGEGGKGKQRDGEGREKGRGRRWEGRYKGEETPATAYLHLDEGESQGRVEEVIDGEGDGLRDVLTQDRGPVLWFQRLHDLHTQTL